MRQSPTEGEYAAAPAMSDTQRLEYFLTRAFETDEVWFLRGPAPFERALAAGRALPVWPYRRFASEAALEHWQDCVPASVSLEHFLDHLLGQLPAETLVEIMPRGEAVGCLVAPGRLRAILEGMMDAGEYRLDG